MHAGLELELLGEDVVQHDSACKVAGCKGTYRTTRNARGSYAGTGKGYCAKHYRAFLRSGDPLGRAHKARLALREAALAYADALYTGEGATHAKAVLAAAAWELLASTGGGCSHGGESPASADLLAVLCETANAYAWWDDTDDDGFEAVSKKLDADAKAYAKAVAKWVPRGHVAARVEVL